MADSELNVKLTLLDGVSNQLKEINNNISSQNANMQSSFGALSKAMQEVGVSMIAMGTAIVAQLTLIAKTFVDTGTQLTELSETLGMSTDDLSQWGYVAEQNGTTLDALANHIVLLSRSVADVSGGSGVAQKAIKDLGLSLTQLQQMTPEQQFRTVTEAIANQSSATERLALTTSIFGRGAMDLLPILAQGTTGINAEMNQAQALGIVMGTTAAAQGQSFSRSITDLKDSFKGLADTIGPIITSIIQPLIEKITHVIAGITDWTKAHPGLTKALTETALVLGPLLIAFGTLFTLASTLIITIPILSAACMALGVSVGFLAGAVALLTFGLGMIALGIVGLISNMDAKKKATDAATTADYDAAHASDELSQSISEQTGVLNQEKAAEDAATQAATDNYNAEVLQADQIEKLASAYNDSQTAAGKLGITLDDVTNYLLKQGWSAQQVFDAENKYAFDTTNVINGLNLSWKALAASTTQAMQDAANAAAKSLQDTVSALDDYNRQVYAQWQVMFGNMAGGNGLAGIVPDIYYDPSWVAALSASGDTLDFSTWLGNTGQSLTDWQSTHKWSLNSTDNQDSPLFHPLPGMASGGIATMPTLVGERGMPEAVLPLNRDMSLSSRAQSILGSLNPNQGSSSGSTVLNSQHNITLTLDGSILAKFINKQTGLAFQQRQNI